MRPRRCLWRSDRRHRRELPAGIARAGAVLLVVLLAACAGTERRLPTPTPLPVSKELAERLRAVPTTTPAPPATFSPLPTLPPLPTQPPLPTGTPTPRPRGDQLEDFRDQLQPVWGLWDPRHLSVPALDIRRQRLTFTARAAERLTDREAPRLIQHARGDFMIETRVVDQVCATAGLMMEDAAGAYAIAAYQRDTGFAFLTGVAEDKRQFFLDYPYVGQGLAMRLMRAGSIVRAEISTDRQQWRSIGQGTLPLADAVTVGLALWPECDDAQVAFDYFRIATP